MLVSRREIVVGAAGLAGCAAVGLRAADEYALSGYFKWFDGERGVGWFVLRGNYAGLVLLRPPRISYAQPLLPFTREAEQLRHMLKDSQKRPVHLRGSTPFDLRAPWPVTAIAANGAAPLPITTSSLRYVARISGESSAKPG